MAGLEYVIRRLNWRRTHYGIVRMPGSVVIGALPSLEEAEHDRAHREAEVRARVANPFICGPNHASRSRLPEPIFCDWLRDAGIEPLQAGQKKPVNWVGWWEQARVRFTPQQPAHVWAGLDRVRFFEVITRPEGSVGYAVVRVDWEYNDNWMEPGTEGGTPIKVFRKWEKAEQHRRELEEKKRHDLGYSSAEDSADDRGARYETTRWTEEELWPLGSSPNGLHSEISTTFAYGGTAPFYEIVEVDLPSLHAGVSDE